MNRPTWFFDSQSHKFLRNRMITHANLRLYALTSLQSLRVSLIATVLSAVDWRRLLFGRHRCPPTATDVIRRTWAVCLAVSPSVTLVHLAKAVGRNKMPLGKDTCVFPSNRGAGPPTGKGDLGSEPQWNLHCKLRQTVLQIVEWFL